MPSSPRSRVLPWALVVAPLLFLAFWVRPSDPFVDARVGETDQPTTVADEEGEELLVAPMLQAKTDAEPEPEVRTSQATPDITVRVVDADSCRPIAGARLFVMSRLGSIVDEGSTGTDGIARGLRLNRGVHGHRRAQGVVAWHPEYRIGGRLVLGRQVELELTPIQMVRVKVDTSHSITREWLASCDPRVTFKFELFGNPVQAGPRYLEYKVFKRLGSDIQEWSVTASDILIPRYLDTNGTITFEPVQALPNHLVGSLAQLAKRRKPKRLKKTIRVSATVTDVSIEPAPRVPHALIMHYARGPEQPGELFVHVDHVGHGYSTFLEAGGGATFKVFNLSKRTYRPSLIFVVKDQSPRVLACEPVPVDGRTEVVLVPRLPGSLTVRVTGDTGAKRPAVKLTRKIGLAPPGEPRVQGHREFVWPRLMPGEYDVTARGPGTVSRTLVVRVRGGEHQEIELEMRPVCVVTFALHLPRTWTKLIVRDNQMGWERTFHQARWRKHFRGELRAGDWLHLESSHHEFDLPHGSYTFTAFRGKVLWRRTFVLNTPRREIRLK